MIQITKLTGISKTYPEEIEGTNEWYTARESGADFCDLYDAQKIYNQDGIFKGMNYYLIHYPDGEVHLPFENTRNTYVDKPIWNDGVFNFLVVDFEAKRIIILTYHPCKRKVEIIRALALSEVKDCYNLMLETTPLTLGRSGNEGFYEIIWPEKRKVAIGARETVLFRDEDKLYLTEWCEEPTYREYIIIRDIQTGKILEKSEGYLRRLPNNVYWRS